jgi:hypothetical protein
MALPSNKIKSILNTIQNVNNKSNSVWKPELGAQNIIRIVPYKHNPDQFSFIELKFHYGLKVKDSTGAFVAKTFLSPDTFGRPDPIVEWSNRLQKTGDKNDWKYGKSIAPKARTYVPILVRGKENEGIKFWGFGKTVYESILKACDEEVFGDISDPVNGHDIIVEYKEGVENNGKKFPSTSIIVKPKTTPAIDEARKHILEYQKNILDLFVEPTYDQLYNIMNEMMAAQANGDTSISGSPDPETTDTADTSPSTSAARSNSPNIDDQFNKLFGKK